MLKNFPDKGSSLVQKETIIEEIKAIKNVVKEMVVENQSNFLVKTEQTENFDGHKLLGELLGYLRTNKLMSILMVCRQIKKIEIEDRVAIIHPVGSDEISSNEQISMELKRFFDSKGLSYKMYQEKEKRDPVKELNEMLGGKLKVE